MCIEELEEGLDLLETRAPRDGVSVQIRVDKPPVFEFREMTVVERHQHVSVSGLVLQLVEFDREGSLFRVQERQEQPSSVNVP